MSESKHNKALFEMLILSITKHTKINETRATSIALNILNKRSEHNGYLVSIKRHMSKEKNSCRGEIFLIAKDYMLFHRNLKKE